MLEYLLVLLLGVVIGWLASRQGSRHASESSRQAEADQAHVRLQRWSEQDNELKRLRREREDCEERIKGLAHDLREEREKGNRLRQELTELAARGGPTDKVHGEATRSLPDDWREQP